MHGILNLYDFLRRSYMKNTLKIIIRGVYVFGGVDCSSDILRREGRLNTHTVDIKANTFNFWIKHEDILSFDYCGNHDAT